jgi:hypothetical protein
MDQANESSAGKRERLLQWELGVVQAAIEKGTSAQEASSVPKEWSAKLQKWRDELKGSLRRLSDRAA